MKKVVFYLVSFCMVATIGTSMNRNTRNQSGMIVNNAIEDFAKKMKKKGYHLGSFGGSEEGNKTRVIEISFDTNEVLEINKVRETIHQMVGEFLSDINANDQIGQYLCESPFQSKGMNLGIFTSTSVPTKKGDVVIASLRKNKIVYYAVANTPSGYEKILEEPF